MEGKPMTRRQQVNLNHLGSMAFGNALRQLQPTEEEARMLLEDDTNFEYEVRTLLKRAIEKRIRKTEEKQNTASAA